jgi:hypothetical protein
MYEPAQWTNRLATSFPLVGREAAKLATTSWVFVIFDTAGEV